MHGSCSFNDVKVHLAMAPDAVVFNLHADAPAVICNEKYQRRRPTTGIMVAHFCTSCRTDTACPDSISVMEKAALHRMATSIAQLTLCQVTSEEIETATKLLEKAGQKLRGFSDVPPQRIADLDNATRQLRQLSCILDSCTILTSYEVSQAQKALLLLPRTEKGSIARLLKSVTKSIMPTYRIFLTKTTGKSTRTLFKADDRQSTRERTLSGP